MTCEHVLAQNPSVPTEDAPIEWRAVGSNRWQHLGRLAQVGGIDYERRVAHTDSAMIRLERNVPQRVPGIGTPAPQPMNEYEAVATRALVRKCGYSTGVTTGRVEGILDIVVRYHDPASTLIAYPGVLEIVSEFAERREFCQGGDSGSVLWDVDRRRPRAVGLLCSTVLQYKGYAIPFRRALDAHGVRL